VSSFRRSPGSIFRNPPRSCAPNEALSMIASSIAFSSTQASKELTFAFARSERAPSPSPSIT
jgi:hypothetical protein